jgi:hypothetical protein
VGALENASRENRNLHSTTPAVQKTIRHHSSIFALAARTPETLGPPEPPKIPSACVFIRKTLLKFDQCPGIVFDHDSYPLHLGAC